VRLIGNWGTNGPRSPRDYPAAPTTTLKTTGKFLKWVYLLLYVLFAGLIYCILEVGDGTVGTLLTLQWYLQSFSVSYPVCHFFLTRCFSLFPLLYSSTFLTLLLSHSLSLRRYSFMRRNVRRLNREIGHHSASLTNPTAVIPLSVPSSYQPRKVYEKKNTSAAVDIVDEVCVIFADVDILRCVFFGGCKVLHVYFNSFVFILLKLLCYELPCSS